MNEIGGRINEIIQANKLKKFQFAEKLGIDQSYVSKLVKGDNNPSDSLVMLICREFSINEEWLRYGTGPMSTLERPQDMLDLVLMEFDLPRETRELFIRYGKLPKESRVVIKEMLRGWIVDAAAQIKAEEAKTPEQEAEEYAQEMYQRALQEKRRELGILPSPESDTA